MNGAKHTDCQVLNQSAFGQEEGSSESEGDVNELVNFKHSRHH